MNNCFNKKELKNISRKFRTLSSRILNCDFEDLEEKNEVSYIYQILRYITDHNINCRVYTMGYAHSNKYQDMVEGFGERFLLPFINYIDGYFERIFTEMGFDENNNYNITINGGQVNISKDNSILNAVQNSNNESI